MQIAVRTDASREIGTGHLMRCLTLADALSATGAKVTFFCALSTALWRELIEARGHCHVTLDVTGAATGPAAWPLVPGSLPWSQEADADALLNALPMPVDLMIVDHYGLDHRWERLVRRQAARLLVIDDLANRAHDCDVLLDQAGMTDRSADYDRLVPAGTIQLLGPRFALLRPSFAAARACRKPADGHVRRISVFMGGTDSAGAAKMALEALSRSDLSRIALDVIADSRTPHRRELQAAAGCRAGTNLHFDVSDPAQLFASADLAIGAGGVAALERCCLGLPTVAIAVAENQLPSLGWFARAGAVRYLGMLHEIDKQVLADQISALCECPGEVAEMAARARALVDGFGTPRVVRALETSGSAVDVRLATMGDAKLLHQWRNDPSVRAISMTTAPIAYSDHRRWLATSIQDPKHIVLVGTLGKHPIGSVRYRLHDAKAMVSIVVAPEMRAEGIGGELLAAGEAYLTASHGHPVTVVAAVRPGNRASMRLFASSGFELAVADSAQMLYRKRLG